MSRQGNHDMDRTERDAPEIYAASSGRRNTTFAGPLPRSAGLLLCAAILHMKDSGPAEAVASGNVSTAPQSTSVDANPILLVLIVALLGYGLFVTIVRWMTDRNAD